MSTISEPLDRPRAGRSNPTPCAAGAIVLRRAIGLAAVVLLAACGGGGGDSGGGGDIAEPQAPPTTGAALASSTAEAAEAAKAVAGGGERVAERAAVMNGVSAALGGPVTPASLPPGDRKQALAVTNAPCSDVLDPPCSGSAVIDTNLVEPVSRVVPGDYIDMTFNDLRGRLDTTTTVALNGRMRMVFETALDLNASTFRGLSAKIRFDAFSATVNGVAFGPVTETARLRIDNTGSSTVTAGGASYTGLSGVTISSTGNYTVGGGTVRLAYWGASTQYIDVTLSNWRVVAGRPAVGSQATINGASGTMTARVTASGTGSVVYLVTVTSGGTTASYIVTATYPASGIPTYTAVRN